MSPEHYREMARECLQEAADAKDEARKKTLVGIAKLYNQTALAMEAAQVNTESGRITIALAKTN